MGAAETALRVMIGIFGVVGLILNIIVLIVLFRSKLTSKITTALMRSQCIADGYASTIATVYQILGPVIITPSIELNRVLCYAYFQDEMFWLGALLSVHNLVCISFDRLIAVVRPVYYRLNQLCLMVGCYIYLTFICLLLYIPNFALRHYSNNTCSFAVPIKASPLHQFLDIHSLLWFLMAYLIPAIFVIACHLVVIRFVRQTNTQNHEDEERKAHRGVVKLIKITAALAASILTFHAPEAVRYVLASYHILDYAPGAPEQQVGVLFITFCCFLNPCMSLNAKVSLRRIVNRQLLEKISKWRMSTGQWTMSNVQTNQ